MSRGGGGGGGGGGTTYGAPVLVLGDAELVEGGAARARSDHRRQVGAVEQRVFGTADTRRVRVRLSTTTRKPTVNKNPTGWGS